MKKFVVIFTGLVALAGCQSTKAPDQMTNDETIAANEAMAAKGDADTTKYPVKTKDGMVFGGKRSVPNDCRVPTEGKQKGVPLTQAVVDGWPKQFTSDIAIMQAALAGVAYPEEVAYIAACIDTKVTGKQVPGPMPGAIVSPASTPVPTETAPATTTPPADPAAPVTPKA